MLKANISTFLTLSVLLTYCGSGADNSAPLTFQVSRTELISSVTAKGTVEALRKHPLSAPRLSSLPMIRFLAPEFSFVRKDELVVEFNGEEIRARLEQAERSLESARSDLAKLDAEQQAQIAQLEAQVKRAEASMESSRLKLAELEFVSPRQREIRELRIEMFSIQDAKARRKLESTRKIQHEERSQQLLRIKQEQRKLDKERASLALVSLKAPVDGYVLYYWSFISREFFKPGDVAIPGWAVAAIADISTVQIKLQLSETEVQNMETGQEVEISVESLEDVKLNGKVTQIAQVAKPVRHNSDVKRVEVLVTVEDPPERLVPGITATCTIIKQRVEDALVVPLESVFEQDSTRIVYEQIGSDFLVREVEMGQKGNNFAIILNGLEGGEKLALSEPERSIIEAN